ncbi:conserved hypothetical protein [Thermoanaerobacter mathranii subsp. mathranii str. A3]|uniref:Uncharacterized protein n=1 Tax=Thermoanaerobacter mathranii subsp. mathranii (strain DSM 11426 / CCUG 53645 / CIP 108742 / A3) TaxID=583358 RepID=A0ABM5LTC7_THEM3|nr:MULTISPECIES: hypothetical protein [Thermoanaerobacter]ADH61886.1 conserved hypothetical protein [Thermoanaerobacter mathranii subsp. mathranii str. A3]MDK2814830.1 hypothetical protein [Thermoanaerobacter sp.]
MKKIIVLFVAVVMFMTLFMSYGYAKDLITVKTDIDDVKTDNKYFIISGSGQPNTVVELILNDNLSHKWVIDDTMLFAKLLTLSYGDNYIVIKAYKGDQLQILKGHVILTKKDGVLRITITAIEDIIKSLLR